MFDKCAHLNMHARKPVWAGCVSSLYYIIQNIFLCSIIQNVFTFANKIYIHIYQDIISYHDGEADNTSQQYLGSDWSH